MLYFPTGSEMQKADQDTINRLKVPSQELMERAGKACVDVIYERDMDLSSVLILAGNGNNGGDGFVIARLLSAAGHSVGILYRGSPTKLSAEAKANYDKLEECKITFYKEFPKESYTLIIDTMFGVGLNRNIEGAYCDIINEANERTGVKLSIDIPSGISAETGLVMGTAFKADYTIAIQNIKVGHLLEQGRNYSGEVICKDIGISVESFKKEQTVIIGHDIQEYKKLLPKRDLNANKGTFGKLLIIAGSKGMAGAAILNALAAYRSGVGLVKIYTHEDNRSILQSSVFEGIVATYTDYNEEELDNNIAWADTVLIGSGIGLFELSNQILSHVVMSTEKPCVIDGDGLTLLSRSDKLKEELKKGNFVLTPHIKEMSRVIKRNVKEIKEHRKELLWSFVHDYKVTCVLKDARTLIGADNHRMVLNQSGNAAMAKAGSGDVLAGIIGALISEGLDNYRGCILGVYIHGASGDISKRKLGDYSVMARDLIDDIGEVFKTLGG